MKRRKQHPTIQQAVCPRCWQTVSVHPDETYFMHGKLREVGQQPAWCAMSNQPLKPLFPLGRQVMTPGAGEVLQQANYTPQLLLKRHQVGDWGQIPPEDATANLEAVRHGLRILSSYPLPSGQTLWIISEADRSATTLLRPDEY